MKNETFKQSYARIDLLRLLFSIVNFINVKCTNFSYTNVFFYVQVTREKLLKQHFVRKICTFNVDEFDTCSQYHRHFTQMLVKNQQFFFAKKIQTPKKLTKAAQNTFVQKAAPTMLVKISTGLIISPTIYLQLFVKKNHF